jgi:hypothetical protein
MARELVVDFNALPASIRQRFIQSTGPSPQVFPILAEHGLKKASLPLWFLFGAAPLLPCLAGQFFVDTFKPAPGFLGRMNVGFFVAWWAAIFFLMALGTRILSQRMQRAALPFRPGRYLFPTCLVDAASRQLRITLLDDLASVHSLHMHVNGMYDYTVCTFGFREGAPAQLSVRGKEAVEAGLRELDRAREAAAKARVLGDDQMLQRYDLFFNGRGVTPETWQRKPAEDRGSGPLAQDVPGFVQKRWVLALVASVVVAPISLVTLRVIGDNSAFARAQAKGTPDALLEYAQQGWRHIEEAKGLGAQANYKACERNDTEVCWRLFMGRWSDSPLAQKVHDERLPKVAPKAASSTPP